MLFFPVLMWFRATFPSINTTKRLALRACDDNHTVMICTSKQHCEVSMSQVQAIVKSTECKALQESSPQNHELTPPPPQYTAACLCRARVTLRDFFRTSCLTNLFFSATSNSKKLCWFGWQHWSCKKCTFFNLGKFGIDIEKKMELRTQSTISSTC